MSRHVLDFEGDRRSTWREDPEAGVCPRETLKETAVTAASPSVSTVVDPRNQRFSGTDGSGGRGSFVLGVNPRTHSTIISFLLGSSRIPPFSVFGYSPGSGGHKTQNVSFPLPGETPEVTQRREWKRKSFVTAGKTWPTNVDWYPMPGLSSTAVTRISSHRLWVTPLWGDGWRGPVFLFFLGGLVDHGSFMEVNPPRKRKTPRHGCLTLGSHHRGR